MISSLKEEIVNTVKGKQVQDEFLNLTKEFVYNGKNLLMIGGKN